MSETHVREKRKGERKLAASHTCQAPPFLTHFKRATSGGISTWLPALPDLQVSGENSCSVHTPAFCSACYLSPFVFLAAYLLRHEDVHYHMVVGCYMAELHCNDGRLLAGWPAAIFDAVVSAADGFCSENRNRPRNALLRGL